jgi:hypothetical protein
MTEKATLGLRHVGAASDAAYGIFAKHRPAEYPVHFEQQRPAGTLTAAMAVSKLRLLCGLTLAVCLAGCASVRQASCECCQVDDVIRARPALYESTGADREVGD